MLAYLSYMAERLAEIKRLLRTTGIYLHCDPTASHYLKVIMDSLFGSENFRNEIVWKRTSAHSDAGGLGSIHDIILLYSMSGKWDWNKIYVAYEQSYIDKYYKHVESDGRLYMDDNLTAKGLSGGGYEYEYKGARSIWRVPESKMKELDRQNRLYFTNKGGIRIKRYLNEMPGVPLQDLWTDINPINSQAAERLGYPTQKPIALMERILRMSSKEGDVVLDPFCGCGTTIEAARQLRRRFIGIDISPFAIEMVRTRRLKDSRIPIHGIPSDMSSAKMLARDKPFDFEKWAITRIPGMAPNRKQVGDSGIDGRGKIHHTGGLVLAQVKGGKFNLSQFRDFLHVFEREGAECGIYITLDDVSSRQARTEAVGIGYFEMGASRYPKVQLYSLADYFDNRIPELPALSDPYTGKQIQKDWIG